MPMVSKEDEQLKEACPKSKTNPLNCYEKTPFDRVDPFVQKSSILTLKWHVKVIGGVSQVTRVGGSR